MAVTFTLSTVEPPTNVSASLVEGGSLSPNTTYYYCIQTFGGSWAVETLSVQTEEVSATTTDTHRSIKLSFTQTVSSTKRYIVLRTTTSGDYNANNPHALRHSSHFPAYWENVSEIIDTGYDLTRFPNYPDGHPTIRVNSNAVNDSFTLEDMYQADLANGWGLVRRLGPPADTSRPTSNYDTRRFYGYDSMVYEVNGSIDVASPTYNVTWRMFRETLVSFGGINVASTDNITCHWGTKSATTTELDMGPTIIIYRMSSLYQANGSGTFWMTNYFYGVNKWYGVVMRSPALNDGVTLETGPYREARFYIHGRTGHEYQFCRFDLALQLYFVSSCNFTRCIFKSHDQFRSNNVYNNCTFYAYTGIEYGALPFRLGPAGTYTLDTPVATNSRADLYWGYHTSTTPKIIEIIDGTFTARGQTNNQPYHHLLFRLQYSIYIFMYLKFRLDLKVIDRDGNPISGASVKIVDSQGNEVSGSPFTTNSNGNITTVTLIGRKLRTMWGEPTQWEYAFTHEGYEDALVAMEGVLERTYYTPHTVTISKSGYQTKTIKYTMDRKREEVEVLEKVLDYNLSRKARVLSQ